MKANTLYSDFIDAADDNGNIKNNKINLEYCNIFAGGLAQRPALLSKLVGLYIYPTSTESSNLINFVNPSVNLIRKDLGGSYSHTDLGLQGLYSTQIPYTASYKFNMSMGSYITQLPTGYGYSRYLMGVDQTGGYTGFLGMYLLGNGVNQGVQTLLTNFANYGTIVKGLHILNLSSYSVYQWFLSKNDKILYGQYGGSTLADSQNNNFLIGGHSAINFGSPLATPSIANSTYDGYQGCNFITNQVLTVEENNYLYYLIYISQVMKGRQ